MYTLKCCQTVARNTQEVQRQQCCTSIGQQVGVIIGLFPRTEVTNLAAGRAKRTGTKDAKLTLTHYLSEQNKLLRQVGNR